MVLLGIFQGGIQRSLFLLFLLLLCTWNINCGLDARRDGTGTEEGSGARTGGIWEDGRKMVARRMRIIKSKCN